MSTLCRHAFRTVECGTCRDLHDPYEPPVREGRISVRPEQGSGVVVGPERPAVTIPPRYVSGAGTYERLCGAERHRATVSRGRHNVNADDRLTTVKRERLQAIADAERKRYVSGSSASSNTYRPSMGADLDALIASMVNGVRTSAGGTV